MRFHPYLYSSGVPTAPFCLMMHCLLQIFLHTQKVHKALLNLVIVFEEQCQLPIKICLQLWILNIWVSFKNKTDQLHHYLVDKLSQGQCHQDQASENLKLQ